jgi:hypothetical protein
MLSESHLHDAFYRSGLTDPAFAGSAALPIFSPTRPYAITPTRDHAGCGAPCSIFASVRRRRRSRYK